MIAIKKIDFKDTFIIRHPVLRAGKPIESCFFDGDDLESTFHFGLFDVDKLVGVISVFKNKNATFRVANQFQIRGMAILQEHRQFGYGKLLLQRAEEQISKKKGDLIWFNAREIAVPFYQKLGYEKFGKPYEIEGIGTHYLMFKNWGNCL
jgi:predicted GNAT family N-acyltransferase